jgi:alanine dehydrogenase
MIVLSADDVREALPMPLAIEAMKRAFAALAAGRTQVPLRAPLDVAAHHGVTLVMPALVADDAGEALAIKVVSLFEHNRERGLARIQAAVLVIDPTTGVPAALLEGSTLTAIRTGAASGAATDLLARSDSQVAAVFGAGVQARTQLEAVCTVRPIQRVWVYDPAHDAADAFCREFAGKSLVPKDIRWAESPAEALAEADVVCAASTSHTPVFADADLKAGTHVNAIGSYQPHVQELPPETVCRALVVVDHRESALAETGDLIQPIRNGLITEDHIHAELGELLLGQKPGRSSPDQITLFKSVGVAVQDAVAAREALRRATELHLGQQVKW